MKKIAIGSIVWATSLCSIASACPMCRDAVTTGSGGTGNPPVALFNASVIGILGAFLGVAILLIAKIVGAVRLVDRAALGHAPTLAASDH